MHTLPMDSRGTSRQIEFELWLWPSSDRDSSAKTGVRVAPGDTAAHPYFGATRGYVEADDSSGRAPRRADVDPVYARVIMLRILGDSIGRAPAAILVWTIATRSPGWMGLDGAGEALWVSEISPTGFRGRWVPWGIVTRGEGYYCAERVKD